MAATASNSNYAFISHSIATFPNQQPKIDNMQLARRKRRRTSPTELSILEQEFCNNCRPDKHQRESIASSVGMTEKAVQIWFQNKRQSFRKKGSGSLLGRADGGADGPESGRSTPSRITTTTVNTEIPTGLPTPPLSCNVPLGFPDTEGPGFAIYSDSNESTTGTKEYARRMSLRMSEEDGKAVLVPLKRNAESLKRNSEGSIATKKHSEESVVLSKGTTKRASGGAIDVSCKDTATPLKAISPSKQNRMAITALISSSPLKGREEQREVECISNLLSLRWASA